LKKPLWNIIYNGGIPVNILKKEMKWNFKFVLLWTIIFVLFGFMYIPITGNLLDDIKPMLGILDKFPKALLSAFNIDKEILSGPEGMFGSEGMSFMYIIGSVFAAMFAGNLFAKEFEEKTIEYILIKPVSRYRIYYSKISTIIIYIMISAAIFLINVIFLFKIFIAPKYSYSTDVLIAFGVYFLTVMIFFSSVSVLTSVISQKNSLNITISLGLTIFMYFGSTLAQSYESIKAIGKISIFTYIPLIDTIKENKIFWTNSFFIIIISVLIFILSSYIFNKREVKI